MSASRMTDDPELVCSAYVGRSNYLQDQGLVLERAEMAAEFFQFALDAGVLSMAAYAAGLLADNLLTLGRLPESNDVIREGISLTGMPDSSAMVRLSAASLAVRQGNLEIAGMHVQRAKELIVGLEMNPGLGAPPVLAEHLLATGHPEQALDLLTETMIAQFADPRVADEMLMWGARAAADLTEHARDRCDSERVRTARAAYDSLVALRESLQPPPFKVFAPGDPVQSAMKALFTAEAARSVEDTTAPAAWEEAVSRCDAAAMRWEHAIASWRWAQALLHQRASRAVVAVPLRSAHRFAVEAGARPLLHQVETLATVGQILLEEPAVPSHARPPGPFASLTERELEVLSHLVAGRTYAEIASSLFISEKTVSAHVSNLLRKTGTASRHDVSALAVRLGQA